MKPLNCAAVDLGASSGRIIVGTWTRERLQLTEVHRFQNAVEALGKHDYWNLPGIWEQILVGLTKARKSFPHLASVGIDAWGVDHVLVNNAGRPIFPTHAYRDRRTNRLHRQHATRQAVAQIYNATGIPNLAYNTSLQLAETIETSPSIVCCVDRCLLLPDYFNYLLSGRMETEVSIASTTQLLAAAKCEWSQPTLKHFGIPSRWFRAPVRSGHNLGSIRGHPMLRGVSVIGVPGHDTACAYDAMPRKPASHDAFLSVGTWSLAGFESSKPLLDQAAMRAGVSNERTGRGGYRPLIATQGLWLLEQTLKEIRPGALTVREWSGLIRAAQQAPRPSYLLNVLDSSFSRPISMKAAIDAALKKLGAPTPASTADYIRLICESLAHRHAKAILTLQELSGRRFDRVLMVGGGSKNPILCQATATAADLPVWSYSLEGSATGNIANQLISLGVFENLAGFREASTRYLPYRIWAPRG